MAALARQKPGGVKSATDFLKEQASTEWLVSGAADSTAAKAAIRATAPFTITGEFGTMTLKGVEADEEPGPGGVYNGVANYSLPEWGPRNTGDTVFTFDTTGGSQHIKHSRATSHRYPSGTGTASAPDLKGFINVTESDVGGVDITVPAFAFSATKYYAADFVTTAYINTLYNLTGTVNNAPWQPIIDGQHLQFQEGEALYMGASGSKRGIGDVEITHHFAASANATNLTVGDLTGISKRGWEYLWTKFKPRVEGTGSNARVVMEEDYVYVEQVYLEANFGTPGSGASGIAIDQWGTGLSDVGDGSVASLI